MGELYKITVKKNQKSYIGISSVSARNRFVWHCNPRNTALIAQAIKKHGKENVDFEVLAKHDDREVLEKLEIAAILKYGTRYPHGYNCTDGGDGSLGCAWNEERKASFIEKIKAYTSDPENKKNISERGKKRWASHDERNRLSRSLKKYYSLPGSKEKLTETLYKRWNSEKGVEEKIKLSRRMKQRYANEELRNEKIELFAKYWESEENQLNRKNKLKAFYNLPENKIKQSLRAASYFADPENRKKISKTMCLIRSTTEAREKQSVISKSMWADPRHRLKRKLGVSLRQAIRNNIPFSYLPENRAYG